MHIKVQESSIHGRGVFALKDFQPGEVIEVCPVLVLSAEDTRVLDKTEVYNYYYSWQDGGSALALGYGSLYNHSYTPNAVREKDFKNDQIVIRAHTPIRKGEEITHNYNGDPTNQKKVWFEAGSAN